LVCGALSCPRLRRELYSAEKLNSQLEEQGKLFLNNTQKNRFDPENKIAYLSEYFNWYKKDFGSDKKQILLFTTNFINNSKITDSIMDDPDGWNISFISYNWCLNVKGAKMNDDGCIAEK